MCVVYEHSEKEPCKRQNGATLGNGVVDQNASERRQCSHVEPAEEGATRQTGGDICSFPPHLKRSTSPSATT